MQVVGGAVSDRPWGLTLGALGLGQRSVLLTLRSDDRVFRIAFDRGAVIAASSPVPADSIARVALTSQLITPAEVDEVRRRLAGPQSADEVEVLAAIVRLSPEQARSLRRRLVTQRSARTFSIEHGTYELEERPPLPLAQGAAAGIDVRAIIYVGARLNLSELRLALELRRLGTRFALRPGAVDDLPRYGFTRTERPVLEALRRGTSLPELEANQRELDPRVAQAVLYALASCGALVPAAPLAAGSGALRPITEQTPVVAQAPAVAPPPAPPPPPPAPPPVVSRDMTVIGGRALRPPAPPRVKPPVPPPRTRSRTVPPRTRSRTVPPPAAARAPSPPPIPSRMSPPVRTRTGDRPRTERDDTSLPRSMLDVFRTNRTTTVRPNALAAHEVLALIAERTALIERGVDHFTLLGISIGAPIEDVHAAYVELARHLRAKRLADLGISDEGLAAERVLAQIGIAFTVLTDRILRPAYIASLRGAAGPPA